MVGKSDGYLRNMRKRKWTNDKTVDELLTALGLSHLYYDLDTVECDYIRGEPKVRTGERKRFYTDDDRFKNLVRKLTRSRDHWKTKHQNAVARERTLRRRVSHLENLLEGYEIELGIRNKRQKPERKEALPITTIAQKPEGGEGRVVSEHLFPRTLVRPTRTHVRTNRRSKQLAHSGTRIP
jgi:hypothetical protein